MRILHLFSANIFTGSVEHAYELAAWQRLNGHEVWLASDKIFIGPTFPHFNIPVHRSAAGQRWRNVRSLRSIVKRQKIQIVHCHSRAASIIAHRALKGLPVSQLSTIHGRQGIHFKSVHRDVYGQQIIAISSSLKTHLVEDLRKDEGKINVIPNGLGFPPAVPNRGPMQISLIGRLNGPKGAQAARLFRDVFPVLLRDFPNLTISIIGDTEGPIPEDGDMHLARLKGTFGARVQYPGFVADVMPLIEQSQIIIGAGRVALKALAAERTLLALGESGCCGIARTDNVAAFCEDNFGDTGNYTIFDAGLVRQTLSGVLRQPQSAGELAALSAWARGSFALDKVARSVMQVYEKAIGLKFQPRWMPILMYHKVPLAPIDSPHKIFVTLDQFRRHLKWMKWLGRTPVTLQRYHQLCNGKLPVEEWPRRPVVLTFDDGYKDNYTNALPALKRLGWEAVVFALSDREAQANHWDKDEQHLITSRLTDANELGVLIKAGWELGAHTFSHARLTSVAPAQLVREVEISRKELAGQFGTAPLSFAYPFGDYDEEVKRVTQVAGYKFGLATDTGGMHIEDDRMAIFRVNIFPQDGLIAIWKKTSSWYRKYYFKKRGQ